MCTSNMDKLYSELKTVELKEMAFLLAYLIFTQHPGICSILSNRCDINQTAIAFEILHSV